MEQHLSYTVFTDFDGTIAVDDIGDALFLRFGDIGVCSENFDAYRSGRIDARQCWTNGFATIPPMSQRSITEFALGHAIDPGFRPFVDYCSERSIPVTVLSDGFDAYIDPVLAREGLSTLPRFTNSIRFTDGGAMVPVFPHTDAECTRCANCKRNHLVTRSTDDQVIVYIGDGISDRCPVQYADLVFAKDSLVAYCEARNITFHRFHDFSDVLSRFRTIVETKRPRKRRTAELARKELFLGE